MNTTRIDHTDCTHEATPKGRAWCRADRKRRIADCQARYLAVEDEPNFEGQREYEATVELLAGYLGVELHEAYQIVENGPVVYA
jgi:hypothetical protein